MKRAPLRHDPARLPPWLEALWAVRLGIAAVVVTHNPRLAERMPRRLRFSEGLVVDA